MNRRPFDRLSFAPLSSSRICFGLWLWPLMLALAGLQTLPAAAADRALIMGIVNYPGAPLQGVARDMTTARDIAHALGVKDEGITLRQNGALTLAGLRQTLEDFGRSVARGDRVFIYFSGHGSRVTGPGGICEAALVSQDLQMLQQREFDALLQPVLSRAGKSVVMLDTCHSGAVLAATRQGAGAENTPRARFLRSASTDTCTTPSNVRGGGESTAPSEQPNHYLLASAAESEVAVDGGLKDGGYATTAVGECLAQSVTSLDSNRDGLVTFSELRTCAQARVDRKIQEQRARSPDFDVLSQTLTQRLGPGGDMPIVGKLAAPEASVEPSRTDARALVDTLHGARDPTRRVDLVPTRTAYRIGTDLLEFTLKSDRKGYAFVFAVGASGKIDLLFPNRADGSNLLEQGQTLSLPRAGWRLRSQGPAGQTALLAVVTDSSGWLGELGSSLGPFSRIDNRADAVRELARRLLVGSRCGLAGTAAAPQRDFALETNPCSEGFGAARADVVEQ